MRAFAALLAVATFVLAALAARRDSLARRDGTRARGDMTRERVGI